MEDTITTPIVEETPNTEEVNQTVITTPDQEVKEVKGKRRTPEWVPYGVVAEKCRTIKDLEQQISELMPKAIHYDEQVAFLEQYPEYGKRIQQTYEGYFGGDKGGKEEDDYSPEDEIKNQLESRIQQLENQNLEVQKRQFMQQLEKDLSNINSDIRKHNYPITEDEVYQTMLNNEISSAPLAYQLLRGQKILDIQEQWESKYTQDLKNIPLGTAPIGRTQGALQIRRPKSFDDGVEMALKEKRKLVI